MTPVIRIQAWLSQDFKIFCGDDFSKSGNAGSLVSNRFCVCKRKHLCEKLLLSWGITKMGYIQRLLDAIDSFGTMKGLLVETW